MKKSCLLLIAGLGAVQLTTAQTLTMQYNEPVAGDIHSIVGCDSSAIIPKNTGINQLWDFSSVMENTVGVISTTFVAVASVSSSAQFPGATLAENTGSDYYFYKSAAGQFEIIGFELPGPPSSAINFTNSMIANVWPASYNSTFSDTYSGMATGGISGSYNGSQTVTASGTGSLITPSGATYTNVLQITTMRKVTSVFSAPFVATHTESAIQYDYYAPLNKFPLVTVVYYTDNDGFSTDKSVDISINKVIGCATPTLSIVQSSSVICAGGAATLAASGADNYSWSNLMASGAQQVITPTITTTYTLTGYNTNCSHTQTLTVTQQVAACTGLNDEALNSINLTCYPNPFDELVSIANTSSSRACASVFDISGKAICQVFIESGEIKQLDTRSLDKGIYFINITSSQAQVNKKLVKK